MMKFPANGLRAVALAVLAALAAAFSFSGCTGGDGNPGSVLLNVSYDPTREFYQEINAAFQQKWEREHGQQVKIKQSHDGSGKQARSVIDGQEADVITLALAYDIDMVEQKAGLIGPDWAARLPNNSCPYTSTIVFLVRAGNPRKIRDWDDLVRDGVKVITPNPQTSGGARWNYLAAWGYVLQKELGDLAKLNDLTAAGKVVEAQQKAEDFLRRLFRNVPVLDTGARGATNTFTRGMGDVLIAWENEALLKQNQPGGEGFEVVTPTVSILAEPPVAVVVKNAERHGTRQLAEAYLEYLYTPAGQDIAARHYYRPRLPEIAEKYKSRFPQIRLFTIAALGGWAQAQHIHFDDGGVFDRINKP